MPFFCFLYHRFCFYFVFFFCFLKKDKKRQNIIYKNAIYNLFFMLFFIYKNTEIIKIIIDTSCDILIFPIIKLSVLKASMKNLANEYIIKYISVICPLNFLLFDSSVNIINNANVTNDSYKKVGCTSIYCPAS